MPDPVPRRYDLDLRPRARRQLCGDGPRGLPARVAAAAAEFIAGPLRDDPWRVGKALGPPYEGQRSAPRADYRIRYEIVGDSSTVVVFDVSHRSNTYGI